jgi:hypothetical protein
LWCGKVQDVIVRLRRLKYEFICKKLYPQGSLIDFVYLVEFDIHQPSRHNRFDRRTHLSGILQKSWQSPLRTSFVTLYLALLVDFTITSVIDLNPNIYLRVRKRKLITIMGR